VLRGRTGAGFGLVIVIISASVPARPRFFRALFLVAFKMSQT
jgi:hypothetical protein